MCIHLLTKIIEWLSFNLLKSFLTKLPFLYNYLKMYKPCDTKKVQYSIVISMLYM